MEKITYNEALAQHLANKSYWVGVGVSSDCIEFVHDHLWDSDEVEECEWDAICAELSKPKHRRDNEALSAYCLKWLASVPC